MNTIVVGAGYFGTNYIKELAGNLVAVVEQDRDRATAIKRTYNIPVFPSLDDADVVDYDAAVIVTPPSSHVELALQIVKAGKLVLVEKPMATSMQEALLLRKYKNQIMAGMIYLYHPSIEELKHFAEFMPLHHAFSRRTNDGPVRSQGNVAWDLAVHDISIYNYIFGQEPHAAEVMQTRDWCLIRLVYATVEALIYASWHGGPKVRRVELVSVNSDREIFDDLAVVLEVSPLRRMLNDFMSATWDERCSYDAGLEVVNVLDKLGNYEY